MCWCVLVRSALRATLPVIERMDMEVMITEPSPAHLEMNHCLALSSLLGQNSNKHQWLVSWSLVCEILGLYLCFTLAVAQYYV